MLVFLRQIRPVFRSQLDSMLSTTLFMNPGPTTCSNAEGYATLKAARDITQKRISVVLRLQQRSKSLRLHSFSLCQDRS